MQRLSQFTILLSTLLALLTSPQTFAKNRFLIDSQSQVKNQGNADTCAFFASVALLESVFKTLNGFDYDLSESFESYRSKVLKNQRPEVEFGDTYQIIENVAEDLYVQTESGKKLKVRGLKPKLLSQLWSSKSWSDLIIDEIDAGRPVVVTLKVAIPKIDDKNGLLPMNEEIHKLCENQSIACGGHAVLLVGYDTDK